MPNPAALPAFIHAASVQPQANRKSSPKERALAFQLPDLPYAYDALQPYMSAETLEYHHDKHHNAYVETGNKLLQGTGLEGASVEEVVKASYGQNQPLFNNAGQHYNHIHFWNWMKAGGGGSKMPGALQAKIDSDLGGYDKFREAFIEAGKGQFGSGWAWLAMKDGKLEIMKTPNGENPLVHGGTPLLGVDVWEHSYYIDYRNARPKYLEAFVDNLINWEYVEHMFKQAS
jgi:Fe-Mn family superoxide dismutase